MRVQAQCKTKWVGFLAQSLFAWAWVTIPPTLAAADLSSQRAEGQRIAAEVRALAPRSSSTNTALLKTRNHLGARLETAVTIRTTVGSTNWQTDYVSGDGQLLRITRVGDAPGQLLTGRSHGPAPQPAENLLTPFANSDFWLIDLGLGFFHWPEQRLVAKEQRKGEACFVLESLAPSPAASGYSRVKTWLDQDSLGIVTAEAFDSKGRLLKVFEPKRFQKVAGKWQLKEMEIRNEQTDTRTSLTFDVEIK
jgi:Outer membrane lipoprotein-sorting protein